MLHSLILIQRIVEALGMRQDPFSALLSVCLTTQATGHHSPTHGTYVFLFSEALVRIRTSLFALLRFHDEIPFIVILSRTIALFVPVG